MLKINFDLNKILHYFVFIYLKRLTFVGRKYIFTSVFYAFITLKWQQKFSLVANEKEYVKHNKQEETQILCIEKLVSFTLTSLLCLTYLKQPLCIASVVVWCCAYKCLDNKMNFINNKNEWTKQKKIWKIIFFYFPRLFVLLFAFFCVTDEKCENILVVWSTC